MKKRLWVTSVWCSTVCWTRSSHLSAISNSSNRTLTKKEKLQFFALLLCCCLAIVPIIFVLYKTFPHRKSAAIAMQSQMHKWKRCAFLQREKRSVFCLSAWVCVCVCGQWTKSTSKKQWALTLYLYSVHLKQQTQFDLLFAVSTGRYSQHHHHPN